jgi:ligand-binding sensor domain-containing protein
LYQPHVIFCFSLQVFGIDRDRGIDQLYHTSWTNQDGAPGEVHALAQTSDGYLWLGTPRGLFRFDGVRFEHYESRPRPTFAQSNITCLWIIPGVALEETAGAHFAEELSSRRLRRAVAIMVFAIGVWDTMSAIRG